VGFSTQEIGVVRALPVVLAVGADGRWQSDPGFIEVVFRSTAVGKHHQAYVDGQLAGMTQSVEDRSIVAAGPEAAASVIEVVAVDPQDRLTDYGSALAGFGDSDGSRVEVSWWGGRYLDDGLDHFDVYGGPAGAIDRGRPLNAEPVAALVNGANLGGFGCGPFGRGGFGRSAMLLKFVTAKHFSGRYGFEVAAVDGGGNETSAAGVEVEVVGFARPARELKVASYEAVTRTAHLTWSASLDLPGA